ncbi:MAG TPA: hypothetical protein VHO66_03710 [Ruminiclostridium sp.]|nr:hypothetical protein [Ruminiclostridium sp.]
MKITFPHMGNAYIAVKVLLDGLDLDYYMPPVGDRQDFERGIENSPEFMCLPFKAILGNFLNGLDHGADTILFGGGCGQCRLSYYGDLQKEILKSMGYKFNYIHLTLNHLTYREVMNKLGPFIENRSKAKITKAVTEAAWTVFAVDGIYSKASHIRPREVKHGETDSAMQHFEKRVRTERGFKNIRDAVFEAKNSLDAIKLDPHANPLKIGLIGEIYISSEPFCNLGIEKKLGNLRADVFNTMSVSMWIKKHFVDAIVPIHAKDRAVEAAQPYMHIEDIGGHGVNTIGNAALMSKDGLDGIIQIYPFSCMPEIIAQSAFRDIEKKYGVPIMTLIVDEQTAEAGYITRLEAFTDMLEMRREMKCKTMAGKIGA